MKPINFHVSIEVPPQKNLFGPDETKNNIKIFLMQLKSYVKDNRLLGVDENSRGFSCYFYGHNKTRDCCVAGLENTYRAIRISAATLILLLLCLFGFGSPPYILRIYDNLSQSAQQPHSNTLYYIWSVCITAFLIGLTIIVFLIKVFVCRYNEANDQTDVQVYYWLTLACLLALPFINFVYAILLSFKFKLKAKLQNSNCSIMFICRNHNCALVITCTGIAALSSILQQLSFCGYNIILAAIASPVHTCPLLLIYLSGTFFFVILLAILLKSFHKYGCKAKVCSVTMLIAIVIAIFAVILFIVVKVVAIIAVHSTDDGILSVAGSLLPTIFLTSVGYLGKRSLKIIRSSDARSLNLKKNISTRTRL